MQIKFNAYRKKSDDSLMLYINGSNKVSVGVSGSTGFSPYGKYATEGKRKLFQKAMQVFEKHATEFHGTLPDDAVQAFPFYMCITDDANVGGHKTEADGLFLVKDGKILDCNNWLEYTEE